VTRAELLQMYKDVQTMRRMEMDSDTYMAKLVRRFCHLAIGSPSLIPFSVVSSF
jgi:pyruvate dehydrogenase E1 component alpha subunit